MITQPLGLGARSYPTRLAIDLLALDLDACGRCSGTAANLEAALAAVGPLLRQAGVEVAARKIVVKTADEAQQLRFESSPTIRINGRDIAGESRESSCRDCGELCGCSGQVDCRVWVWQGQEHLEAPSEMILDAILNAPAQSDLACPATSQPFQLPENLRRFFAATVVQPLPGPASGECCDESSCCDPSAKAECCGVEPQAAACGCE